MMDTTTTESTDVLRRYAAGERDFCGANLRWANLTEANLTEANLRWANLRGADLTGADLSGADLTEADLGGADLSGADLTEANLRGANLRGVNLRGVNPRGANLRGANLDAIRTDVERVCASAPAEVAGLLAALQAGRVDGEFYASRACVCLVGTQARLRGCDYRELQPDSDSPAERWALAIQAGDTPETSPVVALTCEWVAAWLAAQAPAAASEGRAGDGG
jgi:uncharacterized protein YjbI with pentapeptide repeats